MSKITVVLTFHSQARFEREVGQFIRSPLTEKVMVLHRGDFRAPSSQCEGLDADNLEAGATLDAILRKTGAKYLLLVHDSGNGNGEIILGPNALERFAEIAESTRAGMVYADFYDTQKGERREHPLNDYQLGSVRDGFDFGAMMLFSVPAARAALKKYGAIKQWSYAALYDLRLKVSIDHHLFHIQEFLYTTIETDVPGNNGERHFDYVDPRNRVRQKEMEEVFTEHLKNIGAYLKPGLKNPPPSAQAFPVDVSVVIPVRNRKNTVGEAVQSALAQKTDFSFNVIVVDNHSTDGTTAILEKLAKSEPRVVHLRPERTDLGIGGCWNEAVSSAHCGRYSVQLDSDDLYNSDGALQTIGGVLRSGEYAMVIGSYTLVDKTGTEISPGLIDHREWTDINGYNNALRIDGLGAPRAFNTEILRTVGFLNVSYGEDYAVALRLSREYRIGRIFESLYLCRRWEGNSDAGLSLAQTNRNNSFKDKIRTIEMLARQNMNRGSFDGS